MGWACMILASGDRFIVERYKGEAKARASHLPDQLLRDRNGLGVHDLGQRAAQRAHGYLGLLARRRSGDAAQNAADLRLGQLGGGGEEGGALEQVLRGAAEH
jgi:hypothetical protein